jgi:hypothetical protein
LRQLPSASFAFPAGNKRVRFSGASIPKQLDGKLQELASVQGGGCHGLCLVHDSGASRNLLCSTSSPLLSHLTNRRPSPPGSVVVGGGRLLPHLEEGETCGVTSTTVKNPHYDLYSATRAAKRGASTIIDCQKIGAVGLNSPVMGAPWSGLASLPGPRLSHPDSPVV